MKRVEAIHTLDLLHNALVAQYGPDAYVSTWFQEEGPHGPTFRGYNYDSKQWVYVSIDFHYDRSATDAAMSSFNPLQGR